MMKRAGFIMTSITMLIALVSCDEVSETIDDKSLKPISLNVTWEYLLDTITDETRGVEVDNNNMNDFGIYAYYEPLQFNPNTSKPQFMDNVKVERFSGTWIYNPIMYWPSQGTISFFGYAPYDANKLITVSSQGVPEFDYTNPTSVALQHDLLLSYPQIDMTFLSLNSDKRLPLEFKHALSNIIFKAGVQFSGAESVRIKSVTISSLKNRATARFLFPMSSENGWRLEWTSNSLAESDTYEMSIENKMLRDIDIKDVIGESTFISAIDGHLMVIPQEINDDNNITVVATVGAETRTTTVRLNKLIPKLDPSMRYVVTVTIQSKVNLELDCNVEAWETKTIEVPEFN